jgi:hypothetical protein
MAWKAEVVLIAGALALGRPRRPSATPGRECIPFGPSHPALFIAYSDKNKGGIVLSCL